MLPGRPGHRHEGDTFHGSVKVKLGPIALVYNGSGTFTEKDEAAHRFVVDAKGKDKRGNGTAGATVTLTMDGSAGDSTDVKVHTDLAITGKPAQFGRGVMQDVSDKLLGQFVACLEQRMGAGRRVGAPAADAPAARRRRRGSRPPQHRQLRRRRPLRPSPDRRADAAAAAAAPAPRSPSRTPAAAPPGADGGRVRPWLRRRAGPRHDRAADPGEVLLEAGSWPGSWSSA